MTVLGPLATYNISRPSQEAIGYNCYEFDNFAHVVNVTSPNDQNWIKVTGDVPIQLKNASATVPRATMLCNDLGVPFGIGDYTDSTLEYRSLPLGFRLEAGYYDVLWQGFLWEGFTVA